jgi:hypothetical protein
VVKGKVCGLQNFTFFCPAPLVFSRPETLEWVRRNADAGKTSAKQE